MLNLSDLSELSHAQKDDLIRMLLPVQQQVQELMAQMLVMQERIKELEGRLALNSKNPSKLTSGEGLSKPTPKSLRPTGKKPTGGQAGHSGNAGKCVLNIVDGTAPDKGQAALELLGISGCEFLFFVGDDVNDEFVFRCARPDWVTVLIGKLQDIGSAMFYLDSHSDLNTLLDRMQEICSNDSGQRCE